MTSLDEKIKFLKSMWEEWALETLLSYREKENHKSILFI